MLSWKRELGRRGRHTGFVVGRKPEHNWVGAGGVQIQLPGAESGHDFKVQWVEMT